MFIKELHLNINYLKEQVEDLKERSEKRLKELVSFGDHLIQGIGYYRTLATKIVREETEKFIQQLDAAEVAVGDLVSSL